ncbi:Carboxylesterase, type B [Cordyceps fumosorosea ARSEF 2679]|uniref:Carboxylesterase, type B n=1 Tax=Cordyceps fumosorosea (strain ARSEF 2679) TaxID=1081104 RepID=A0A167QNF7_CORFA|nr:Carboxylesterase, type B [Cordyceps fumosorosea ARSEF 2679]OAA57799.1 Carboxylesterase, type B [Cordyceps fumosorosea ARSEF 2679]
MQFRPACLVAATALLFSPSVVAVPELVKLPYAQYQGVALENGVTQWLGMRYAAPPTGDRRFRPPEEPFPKHDVQSAASHGTRCLVTGQPPNATGFGEDCLFVNVQAPTRATPKSRLPVLMWLRGDGFGDPQSYAEVNATDFIARNGHDMVVVTFNSRLGPYGFLSRVDGMTTNNGIRDQTKAVEWVSRFIRNFGGDPEQMVLGGSGIGAQNVLVHITMYTGFRASFRGVIAESPSFAPMLTLDEAEAQYHRFAEQMGCSSRGNSTRARRSTDEPTNDNSGSSRSSKYAPGGKDDCEKNSPEQNSFGKNPSGENPSGENPSGQNSFGESPFGENPFGENPSGENSSTQNASEQNPPQQSPEQSPEQNPEQNSEQNPEQNPGQTPELDPENIPEQETGEETTAGKNTPECLLALSADDIQKANYKAVMSNPNTPPWDQWLPVIDFELIMNSTSESFKSGHIAQVPFLMGNLAANAGTAFLHRNASSTETVADYIRDLYPHLTAADVEEITTAYPHVNGTCVDPRGCAQRVIHQLHQESRYTCPLLAAAEGFKKAGVEHTYMYLWDAGDGLDDYSHLGARQNVETALLWGPEHGHLPASFRPGGENHPSVMVKQRYWANFVRSRNPNRRQRFRDFEAEMDAGGKKVRLRVWRVWFVRQRRRLVLRNGGETEEKTTKSLRWGCTFWNRMADRMRI